MIVTLVETKTKKIIPGKLLQVFTNELESLNLKWNFNWAELAKTEGAKLFKIIRNGKPNKIEGLLMITILNQEMLFMDNIEIAPHNFGQDGELENVAGCLITYACKTSIELGKGNYRGYVTFDSKTVLMPFYEKKYGAKKAAGKKMYIDPEQGQSLINRYLEIK